ncbi:hypothetical protein MKW94_016602 [Papaver nudicaule]|uniref:Ammonium transporter AmtB-like domain-containing protein n=1 Tax=Papaver nudicaule TaxID=74823 RepID=A0AA41SIU6_PAPNU|nr:hypothetical protein [Papaver nudicaule]
MANYTGLPPNLLPTDASPIWLNKGDNAWQLTAATFVGLQSVPGLILLYGAGVKKKWAVNSAFMALYTFACVLPCWLLWGYQMSFGEKLLPFWGEIDVALDQGYLLGQAYAGNFPSATMVFFQFVFAAITLILVAGALLGRMNFYAWMMFVSLWLTFSYTFVAFRIIDYSGGYVIHLSSGVAGFTAAYWVGPRLTKDREIFPPNNIILMLAGAGLLWMGWTGFNGDGHMNVGIDASLAVLNTHVCIAASLLTWTLLDSLVIGRPSIIGAVQGMITGLVCITPAAGVVQGWDAVIMGILSGSIPWFTMMAVHKRSELLQKVDDTMAVFHTHAIAGIPKLNRLFYTTEARYIGLFYGLQMGEVKNGFRQLGLQLAGIVFVAGLNIIVTTLICLFIRLLVPLRMSEKQMEIGDDSVHGEEAYAIWGDGEKHGV